MMKSQIILYYINETVNCKQQHNTRFLTEVTRRIILIDKCKDLNNTI